MKSIKQRHKIASGGSRGTAAGAAPEATFSANRRGSQRPPLVAPKIIE